MLDAPAEAAYSPNFTALPKSFNKSVLFSKDVGKLDVAMTELNRLNLHKPKNESQN